MQKNIFKLLLFIPRHFHSIDIIYIILFGRGYLKIRVAAAAPPYIAAAKLIRNSRSTFPRNPVSAPAVTDLKIIYNTFGTFFDVLKNLVHIFYTEIKSEFGIHACKPEIGICVPVPVAFFFVVADLRSLDKCSDTHQVIVSETNFTEQSD